MSIELTEIRRTANGFDYMDEVTRLVIQKGQSYTRRGRFSQRPIMMVCYSKSPPLWEVRHELECGLWQELDAFGFKEVWLMDLSDEYFSARDPRRPADLFCVAPTEFYGFHRAFPLHGRKPFG